MRLLLASSLLCEKNKKLPLLEKKKKIISQRPTCGRQARSRQGGVTSFCVFPTLLEKNQIIINTKKMKLKKNPLINLFSELKILKEENLSLFLSGTRDIKEINVLMDKESECLILDQCVEDLNDYYSLNENYSK